MADNSNYIEKKIKALQEDMKFSFKMTDEVIDIVYRQAVEDTKNFENSNKEPKKESPKTLEYFDNVEEYVKNKEDFMKYLEIKKSTPKQFGRKRNDKNHSLEYYIKREILEVYRKIIEKIDKDRDLMSLYDYCRKEVEKINYDELYAATKYKTSENWP